MSDIAIKCEGLSKQYRIGERERYKALRDVITDAAIAPFRRLRSAVNGNGSATRDSKLETRNLIWALDDVSFEVKRGEVVGIIGRNGAGKSTLLKILSRITKPTRGHAQIHGRVGSLLEVGTGFHSELTGRENIYLNAAILGMRKAEIERKFDEIVAFADVERFIDTPVKRYSSGMYVRLAFAVAAHMETEILIIDEVLAVGDAAFQKKCLGKMGEVSKEGRTILFVSHDMTAIQTLCRRAVLLEDGKVAGDGIAEEQVAAYLAKTKLRRIVSCNSSYSLSENLSLTTLAFDPNPIISGSPCNFEIELTSSAKYRVDELAILIYSSLGRRTAVVDLRSAGAPFRGDESGTLRLSGEIKNLPLVEGDYNIGLFINCSEVRDNYLDLLSLTISSQGNSSQLVPYPAVYRGLVELDFSVSSEMIGRGQVR
jgi:lipopolysaccharide transport system ATP-binding protein